MRGCGRKLGILEIGHNLQVKWEGAEEEEDVSSPEMRVGYCGSVGQRRGNEGLERGSQMWRNCEIVSEGGRNQISCILLPLDKLIKTLPSGAEVVK